MADREGPEQEILAQWLDLRGVLWCHVPNEGLRTKRNGARLKRHGMKRGVPDVLIFNKPPKGPSKYVGTAIELKPPRSHKSVVSAEQKTWLLELEQCGWLTFVAYGALDAIDKLQVFGY